MTEIITNYINNLTWIWLWLSWWITFATDYGILVLYLWGLYCLAFPSQVKMGRLQRTNFWVNLFCLAGGIALFCLSFYFRYTDDRSMSMVADAGNAIFYWILLFSNLLDVTESSQAFRMERTKGTLFHTVRHFILLGYKIYKMKGAWYLVVWAVRLNKTWFWIISLNLSVAFMGALLLVMAVYFVGKKRIEHVRQLEYRE